MIYLDYNATTPLHSEAARAMQPYLSDVFGNPSSIHSLGRIARAALDKARAELAGLIGAQPKEIVFTSGGTESNNLALFGLARAAAPKKRHIVTCSTEHHAVLHPCQQLFREGFDVTYLPVDSQGKLSFEALSKALRPDTALVSIMSANNETGTRHPVHQIGSLCRERGIPFHCDAIQSFGKEKVNVDEWRADLLSIAAHKFYGPKGIGLLYVRSGTVLQPLALGGAQENERRGGTENVAAIVGMATAARLATHEIETENHRLFELVELLWRELSKAIRGVQRNGHPTDRLSNTLNVSFQDCDGEGVIMGLDLEGVAASNGSACMVGSIQTSHVLQAMGVEEKLARATVRFSLGRDSQERNILQAVRRIARVVERLRGKPS